MAPAAGRQTPAGEPFLPTYTADQFRLVDRAGQAGMRGLVPGLAAFFKDPLGCDDARFPAQLEMLRELARGLRSEA